MYSGSTTLSNGVLEVDGAILGTGAVAVEPGALLTGVGLIAGPVTVVAGGTLSPGNVALPTTNDLATGLTTNWFDVAGSSATNLVNVTMNPSDGAVFYRMSLNP
jgi:hypothetical protein